MKNLSFLILLTVLPVAIFAQSNKYLDKNKVKARIFVSNDKFWNYGGNGAPAYEVPKGSGKHAMFANSIWIGGLDQGGNLHLAANTYKQSGTDFWPGPLDTANISAYTPSLSTPYNRVWKVDCDDIYKFITAFNNGSVAAQTYTVPDDILKYPAKGAQNFARSQEPFYDVNNNGIYDPQQEGDYPLIKGHQQVLSIFNDQRLTHTETQGLRMGLEIHEQSYAYSDPTIHDSMQAINYTTFYRYTIYNRSNVSYHDVYITDWSDVDLGTWNDDFIGTDSANNFAYCYNAGPTDGMYGSRPPVSSHVLLPIDCSNDGIDNDGDNFIDEVGEQFMLNHVTYYNNNFNTFNPATINPSSTKDFYHYMQSLWKDTTNFTYGGNAYGGTVPSKFVYSGHPALNTGWTETTAGSTPGDRRLLLTSGPFNLPANSKIEWGYAIVFSQDTLNTVNTLTQFDSRVRRDVKNIKIYDQQHQNPLCTSAVEYHVGITENGNNLSALIYPNPAKDQVVVDLNDNIKNGSLSIFDVAGRQLHSQKIDNTFRSTINVQNYSPGLYLVKISSPEKNGTFKFVKE
jgi:hypothetical protein